MGILKGLKLKKIISFCYYYNLKDEIIGLDSRFKEYILN